MSKFFNVRKVLFLLLFLSFIFAVYTAYYKIHYWHFSIKPDETTDVWTIGAHISFKASGGQVKIKFAAPKENDSFKILNEDISAKGYSFQKNDQTGEIEFLSAQRNGKQNIYYKLTIYDNEENRGKIRQSAPKEPEKPIYDEEQTEIIEKIFEAAKEKDGNLTQKMILLFNDEPLNNDVESFLPVKTSNKRRAEIIVDLLKLKNINARLVRGVRLVENKKAAPADLMLESYEGDRWRIYDLQSAKEGLPKNFIVFQRGNTSLLDVEGGEKSSIRFSVIKSVTSSFEMAEHRAKLSPENWIFNLSIYNLPLLEQNILKWLMVFPLGILVVVLMRNVVGVPTMGTFTPMLVAMSLVRTGFVSGLICFSIIIFIGLLLRTLLSKLNLLLVPRIASVVIFVILIIQVMTVIGYHFDYKISSSAVFFPIIITAWIIERASITVEEEGIKNASKEIFWTMITAFATYGVIKSDYIRHLTFAFNEFNLVILFIVMLLGTYTGYRLTELKRFYPLTNGK